MQMVIIMKAGGNKERMMDTVFIKAIILIVMKAIGRTIKWMDKAKKYGQIIQSTKVLTKMVKNMAMEK